MTLAERMRERLAALQPERIELYDESETHRGHAGWRPGGGTHWRLRIVSPRFSGLGQVARHRLVYAALGDLMSDSIHALAIGAYAPGEPGASLDAPVKGAAPMNAPDEAGA